MNEKIIDLVDELLGIWEDSGIDNKALDNAIRSLCSATGVGMPENIDGKCFRLPDCYMYVKESRYDTTIEGYQIIRGIFVSETSIDEHSDDIFEEDHEITLDVFKEKYNDTLKRLSIEE